MSKRVSRTETDKKQIDILLNWVKEGIPDDYLKYFPGNRDYVYGNLLNGFPLKISDKQWKIIRLQWECIRRNKGYQKDYEVIESLFRKKKELPSAWRRGEVSGDDLRWFSRFFYFSMQCFWQKWDYFMVDPKLTFDKIYEIARSEFRNLSNQELRPFVVAGLGGVKRGTHAVKHLERTPRNLPNSSLVLEIDSLSPDTNIKEHVMSWVKQHRTAKKFGHKIEIAKREWPLYDNYLMVYDLKQKGLTLDQIAKQMFPRLTNKNPNSGRVQISRYYKKAKDLINRDYRKIT